MDRLICRLFGHDAWIESDDTGPYQHSCVRCGWQHPWHGLDPRADLLEPAPLDTPTAVILGLVPRTHGSARTNRGVEAQPRLHGRISRQLSGGS